MGAYLDGTSMKLIIFGNGFVTSTDEIAAPRDNEVKE